MFDAIKTWLLCDGKQKRIKQISVLLVFSVLLFGEGVASPIKIDSILNVSQGIEKISIDDIRKAADQGDAKAQFALARVYYKGIGVQQDYQQAATWFRKAADQGNVDAQTFLSTMYFKGTGVQKDDSQALKWLNLAADQGLEVAVKYRNTLLKTLPASKIKK
ncbi:MAG: tetratricopeptide repeat protein [Methylococcales bacterium]